MTDCSSFHSSSSSSDTPLSRGGITNSRFRIVRLSRPNQSSLLPSTCRPIVSTTTPTTTNHHQPSFGFAIRGGREFGIGFFVSRIEKGSESDLKGLKVGDQIIRVNGYLVDDAVHKELSQYMSCQDRLTLKVRGVGMVPIKDSANEPLTWHMVTLRSSPPIDGFDEYMCRDVRITLNISPRTKLGLGLCKGPEWRPGIFVQFTHEFSIAREAGLRPGDQLLTCNDIDFTNILFSEAVAVMKASHRLELIVRTAAGIDLFPGESSGYNSSSSSVTGDQSPSWGDQASKRLSIVKEEDGNDKLEQRRRRRRGSWDHTDLNRRKNILNIENSYLNPHEFQLNKEANNNKTVIKLSSNGTVINNTLIPNTSKLSKLNDNNNNNNNKTTTVIFGNDDNNKVVTIKENSHITNTTKNNIKVNINPSSRDATENAWKINGPAKRIADICLVSRQHETKTVVVEVHRNSSDDSSATDTDTNSLTNIPPPPPPLSGSISNDHSSLSSSLSLPSCCDESSLSSAISEEFRKRAERKHLQSDDDCKILPKGIRKGKSCVNSQNNDIHNALMDEFRLKHQKIFKQTFADKNMDNNHEIEERQNELKRLTNGDTADQTTEISIPKVKTLTSRYPATPTPDYDISPLNSIKSTIATTLSTEKSQLKQNGLSKVSSSGDYDQFKGTMGRCAAAELAKANGDVAEMESLESFKLTSPATDSTNIRPPAIYFNAQSNGPLSMKKLSRPISVSIGEYIDRKEPNRFEFLTKSNDIADGYCVTDRLKTELERTLSRSNLRKKNDLVNGNFNGNLDEEKKDVNVKIDRNNFVKTQSNVMNKLTAILSAQQIGSDQGKETKNHSLINKTQLIQSETTPVINGILKNGHSTSSSSNSNGEHKNITFLGV